MSKSSKVVFLFFWSLIVILSGLCQVNAATHFVNTRTLNDNCNYIILLNSSSYNSFVPIKNRMVYFDKTLINATKWIYLSGPKLTKNIPVRQPLNLLHLRPVFDAARGFSALKVRSNESKSIIDAPKSLAPHNIYINVSDSFETPQNFQKLQSPSRFSEYAMHLLGAKVIFKHKIYENLSHVKLVVSTEVPMKIENNKIWVAGIPFNPPQVHTGAADGVFEYLITLPSLKSAPTIYASNPKCKKDIFFKKLPL